MGFKDSFDKFKNKAEDMIGDHKKEADQGVDKAADVADDKTGHEHSEKIDEGAEKAKGAMDKSSDDV